MRTSLGVWRQTSLGGGKERHEAMFGAGSWAAAGGPDPENLGMHRLSENTVIMGDTCSTAEKTTSAS